MSSPKVALLLPVKKLHLAQPTISGQLTVFEQAIGEKLFYKQGRKLQLTDTGRIVFHYAEEIFALGRDLGINRPISFRGHGIIQP